MYGPHRTYGYAFGGSGGGFRTIAGAENTAAWDGVVPFVIGSPVAIPNVYTVRALALRVLKDKLPAIVDAVEPGGSGDMYAGLGEEERAVLTEVTRMGFPPRGWFNHKTLGLGVLPLLFPTVVEKDPGYFKDFWTGKGYVGADPPPSLIRARVRHRTTVKKVAGGQAAEGARGGVNDAFRRLMGEQVRLQVESAPAGGLQGAALIVKTGAAAGKQFPIRGRAGDMISISVPMGLGGANPDAVKGIKVGDEVQIDNSDFLAVQYYHRHQVPTPDYRVWDQFRGRDGKPLYPQRPRLLGPEFAAGTGVAQTGRFQGKMIVVESLMDQDAFPWQADWYRSRVKAALGPRLDENFRLWFTDHALHGDQERQADPTRTVSYLGVLQQALLDLSAWVEKGVAPPLSTNYEVVDGQVEVPPTAAERKGIQPVITVTANGRARAEVAVGKPVTFSAIIEVPPDTGRVVAAEWDFEGAGNFPVVEKLISSKETRVTVKTTHAFSKPGTYFPALRAVSQRQGDAKTPYARILNLGRVRVVVQ
jgi:hypothetical protein